MASLAHALGGPVRAVNRAGTAVAQHAGGLGLLAWRTIVVTARGEMNFRDFIVQAYASRS
jgi:hypothetical protein